MKKSLTLALGLLLTLSLSACSGTECDEVGGESSGVEEGPAGVPLCEQHTYSGEYVIDDEDDRYHAQICTVCGYKLLQPHQVDTEEGNCIHCSASGLNTSGITYELHDDNSTYYVQSYNMNLVARDLYIPATYLGKPVTAIANGSTAFSASTYSDGTTYLKFVSLPESIETISTNAFASCYSIKYVYINEGVTSIGADAFKNCYNLESIELPDTVTSIGTEAFYTCYSLKSAKLSAGLLSTGTYTFYNCVDLSEVILPSGIESIGNYAFYGCYSLLSVDFPDTLKSVGEHAFYYCGSLQEAILPEGLEEIGYQAFYFCYSLHKVSLPSTLLETGEYAFLYCYSIEEIQIAEGVKIISDHAFAGSYSLHYMKIPNGVSKIGTYAFYACYSLNWAIIPSSVLSIGDKAFQFDYTFDTVFYEGNEEQWENIEISETDNSYLLNALVYYLDEDGSLASSNPRGNYWHYNDNGDPVVY